MSAGRATRSARAASSTATTPTCADAPEVDEVHDQRARRRRPPARSLAGTRPATRCSLTVDISLQRAAERALQYGIRLAHAGQPLARERRRDRGDEPERTATSSRWPRRRRSSRASSSAGRSRRSSRRCSNPNVAEKDNYPGLNRVTEGLYPPGSTFKPVTALAAMEERLISPFQTLQCTPELRGARPGLQELGSVRRTSR